MYKVAIVGCFDGNNESYGGQVIKTRNIYKILERKLSKNAIIKIDTLNWMKKIINLLKESFNAIKKSENIIILPANNGVKVFVPFFLFFNKFFHRKIFYVVIGGWLPEFLKNRKWLIRKIQRLDKVFVETNNMKIKLKELGIENVEVLLNFKDIKPLDESCLKTKVEKPYQLCTFSRVTKEKGIEDIISVVHELNESGNKNAYKLDIYGIIASDYEDAFNNIMKQMPSYIEYKGAINQSESINVIKDYDLLIFPTYYSGEGVAGTLIDAMLSGVPVIASDWRYNNEVIKNGYNGYLYKSKDNTELYKLIGKTLSEKEKLIEMKKNCLVESKRYFSENAINVLLKEMM